MSSPEGAGGTITAPIWTTEPGFDLPPSTEIPAQSAVRTTIGDVGVPIPTGMKPGGVSATTFSVGASATPMLSTQPLNSTPNGSVGGAPNAPCALIEAKPMAAMPSTRRSD